MTAVQPPGRRRRSQGTARAASSGVCAAAAGAQRPRGARSASTKGSPPSHKASANSACSPYRQSAATARNVQPAASAASTNATALCGLVRQAGPLLPLGSRQAGS